MGAPFLARFIAKKSWISTHPSRIQPSTKFFFPVRTGCWPTQPPGPSSADCAQACANTWGFSLLVQNIALVLIAFDWVLSVPLIAFLKVSLCQIWFSSIKNWVIFPWESWNHLVFPHLRMSQPGNQSLSKPPFSGRKEGLIRNRNSIRISDCDKKTPKPQTNPAEQWVFFIIKQNKMEIKWSKNNKHNKQQHWTIYFSINWICSFG